MSRCSCENALCACKLTPLDTPCITMTINGIGTPVQPYVISAIPVVDPVSGNQLECGPDGLLVPAAVPPEPGGDAFATVAASNTPAGLADFADFVCDGTADQVEIEAALAAYLHVILLQGTFTLSADITIPDGRWLDGSGRQITFIEFAGASPALIPSAGADDITVTNLTVNSNAVNGSCLSFPSGSSNCSASSCEFFQNDTSTAPVVLLGGNQGQFSHNLVAHSGGTIALRVEGAESLVGDNQLYGPVLYVGVTDGILSSNYIQGTAGLSGIFISASSSQIMVNGNIIEDSGEHGIELDGTSNCSIINNIIKNVSDDTANTFDGIHLNTNVDNSNIQLNVVLGSNHRYAVRINNANDNDNWITNNRLPTGLTGIISDLGTATETSAGNKLS